MATDLLPIPEGSALDYFTKPGRFDPVLAKIRAEIDAFVMPDVKTEKGRKEIRAFAFKIAKSRTYIESVGKTLAADVKEIPKKVDATRKVTRETFEAWEDEVLKPVTEWEAADAKRIEAHTQKLCNMQSFSNPLITQGITADNLRGYLSTVEAFVVGPECEEFADEYSRTKADAIKSLSTELAAREKYEAEQEELEQFRKERAEREATAALEKAKRDQDAREQKLKEDAIKDAQAVAERQAAAERDAARIERERLEAEAKRATEEAAAAERRAIEAEANAKRAAEKAKADEAEAAARRERDLEHKRKINNAVVEALVANGVSKSAAVSAVTAIAKRLIPHTTIAY